LLHDIDTKVDSKLIIHIIQGIAQGMNYLHSLASRIVHRDLKSHNVLLDESMTVKLADFGLSDVKKRKYFKSSSISKNRADLMGVYGTPEWMAPEIMEGRKYDQKVDIYSFGIVLCELTSRESPFYMQFSTDDPLEIIEAVLDDGAIPQIPDWCSEFFKPLILRCLDRDPSKRPEFKEIIPLINECQTLEWQKLMAMYDIKRLREFLWAPSRRLQVTAAKELETLFKEEKLTRIHQGSTNSNGLSRRPTVTPRSQSETYCLTDKDCTSLIHSLSFLLDSPDEAIQRQALKTLRWLLYISREDSKTHKHDQEIIVDQALPSALRLLNNKKDRQLQRAASSLVLALSESDSKKDTSFIMSLDKEVRQQICNILQQDIRRLESEQKRIVVSLAAKRGLLKAFVTNLDAAKVMLSVQEVRTSTANPPPLPSFSGVSFSSSVDTQDGVAKIQAVSLE